MISQASTRIYLNISALGGVVLSRSGERLVDFGSVSYTGSARRSPSLVGVLECSQPKSDLRHVAESAVP